MKKWLIAGLLLLASPVMGQISSGGSCPLVCGLKFAPIGNSATLAQVAVSTAALRSDLSAEISRATARENAIATSTGTILSSLNSEISRALLSESLLGGATGQLRLDLSAEISRAEGVEATKQSTGDYITALSGDASATGPGAVSITFNSVNSSPGSCGDATHTSSFTVNSKGLVTSCIPVLITGAAPTGAAGGDLTGNFPSPLVVSASSSTGLNVTYGVTMGSGTVSHYTDMTGLVSQPPAPAAGTARLHALTTNGITRFEMDNEAATNLIFGEDNVFIAKNTSGSDMAKGVPVYQSGATGTNANIALSKSDSTTTLPAFGMTLDPIANNAFGQVMKLGDISGINTNAFAVNDQLWVSPTVAGGLVNVRPAYPSYVQRIGSVKVKGVGNGTIHVTVAPFIGMQESGTNSPSYEFKGYVDVLSSMTVATNLSVGGTAASSSNTVTNLESAGSLNVNSGTLACNLPGYAGKCGIGTATPAGLLDIQGAQDQQYALKIGNQSTFPGLVVNSGNSGPDYAATDVAISTLAILALGTNDGRDGRYLSLVAAGAIYAGQQNLGGAPALAINTSHPATLVHISSGIVTVDGNGSAPQINVRGNAADTNPAIQATALADARQPQIRVQRTGTNYDKTWYFYMGGSTTTLSIGSSNGDWINVLPLTGFTGINTYTPGAQLDVNGTIRQATAKSCNLGVITNSSGDFSACVASDRTLKTHILDMDYSSSAFDSLKPSYFDFIDTATYGDSHRGGFVAQDVQSVYPECAVPAGAGGLLGVDSNCMIAHLTKEIQALRARVSSLEAK